MISIIDIASEQFEILKDEVSYLRGKADGIYEFCRVPILNNMKVDDLEKIKLEKIISKTKKISDLLFEFHKILE